MKIELRNNKDFFAGLMFIVIGLLAVVIAQKNYPMGISSRMGPGYFPTVLGGILSLFGVYVMVRGLYKSEKIQGNWSLRALIMLPLSLVLFGILMVYAGFIPALVALVFVSAASGKEFKLGEVLLVTLFLIVLSVAVFIWGLGLPYPLINFNNF